MRILFSLILLLVVNFGNTWVSAVDCSAFCGLQTNVPTTLAVGKLLTTGVLLSSNFQVKFDVTLTGLATVNSEVRNILEIKDSMMGTTLLKIGITNTRSLRVIYNDVIRSYYSASVVAAYTSTFTTVIFSVRNGVFYMTSSNDYSFVDTGVIDYMVATEGFGYDLYTACIQEESNPPAAGIIKNIEISYAAGPIVAATVVPTYKPTTSPSASPTVTTTTATLNPSRSPTVTPTATAMPTVNPTAGPTKSPSLAPTTGPTIAPTRNPTNAPTLAPTTGPTVNPTTGPTLSPSHAPTKVPTAPPTCPPSQTPSAKPTCGPSRSPTAAPSLPTTDCRVSCVIYSPTTIGVVTPENLIARLLLPVNFLMTFEISRITLPTSAFTINNVITIKDSQAFAGAGNFLKFGIMTITQSTVEYGTSGALYVGPGLVATQETDYTTFSVAYSQNSMTITSSAVASPFVDTVGTAVNTTGRVYDLSFSGADGWYNANVGLIRNVAISSVTTAPSKTPTVSPTVVPTAKPTTLPSASPTTTVAPSIVPTAAPTTTPTAAPSMEVTDCRISCTLAFGASIQILPGTLVARVLMSTEFKVSFEFRRPTLPTQPGVINNLITIADSGASDAPTVASAQESGTETVDAGTPTATGGSSLFAFGLDMNGHSLVEYADGGFSCMGPGLTTDYVGDYTGFAVTYKDEIMNIKSNAFMSPISSAVDHSYLIDTTGTVYDVYVSGASGTSDPLPGLMKSITIGAGAPSPTASPTAAPSGSPTAQPTTTPTGQPIASPTSGPTPLPTAKPTAIPTTKPSATPISSPTAHPTVSPTVAPSCGPTMMPTASPTAGPTVRPTVSPTASPTVGPSATPTVSPSTAPTVAPSLLPTVTPTKSPTVSPTTAPTVSPSQVPTVTPSKPPTPSPSTVAPTASPSLAIQDCRTTCSILFGSQFIVYENYLVTKVRLPQNFRLSFQLRRPLIPDGSSNFPGNINNIIELRDAAAAPSDPSLFRFSIGAATQSVVHYKGSDYMLSGPSLLPDYATVYTTYTAGFGYGQLTVGSPTDFTSYSLAVSANQQVNTTDRVYLLYVGGSGARQDVVYSTIVKLMSISAETPTPTAAPTIAQSVSPTRAPSVAPSRTPTMAPSAIPTTSPSTVPTQSPSAMPSVPPTTSPTVGPTAQPSALPTVAPSVAPSPAPTVTPSAVPTVAPTLRPSTAPTMQPSAAPSALPTSSAPSVTPTTAPSAVPTLVPTITPTASPSALPTADPSVLDCRSGCAINTAWLITPGLNKASVMLPMHFQIRFQIRRVGIVNTGTLYNLLKLRDILAPGSDFTLFKFGMYDVNTTAISYSGTTLSGPGIFHHSDDVWTTITAGFSHGIAYLQTDVANVSVSIATAMVVDPGTKIFYLQTAGPDATAIASAPVIRNLRIDDIGAWVPTAVPTTLPTLAPSTLPTAGPTTVPSVTPTRSPTAGPTHLPSALPTMVPSVAPSTAPTVTPSAAPTSEPTLIPSAVPSTVPTAAPSYVEDCLTGCSLLYSRPLYLDRSLLWSNLRLPTHFRLNFELHMEFPSRPFPEVANVLTLRDISAAPEDPSLLEFGLLNANTSVVKYDTENTLAGPGLIPDDLRTEQWTAYTVTCAFGYVTVTSNALNESVTVPLGHMVNTTHKVFGLYLEWPEVRESRSAYSAIRQLSFEAIVSAEPSVAPSAVPTLTPSATPTAVPSVVPTDAPSEMPTDAPTDVPTDTPTEAPTYFPTAAPTVPNLDCRAGCEIVTTRLVFPGSLKATLLLPANFQIRFRLRRVSVNESVAISNVLELRDADAAVDEPSLFKFGFRDMNNSVVEYGTGDSVDGPGVFPHDEFFKWTTLKAGFAYGNLFVQTSVHNETASAATSGTIDTGSRIFNFYASSPDAVNVPLPPIMRYVYIDAINSESPTVAPTSSPSDAPSVAPSVDPTVAPSAAPSTAVPSVPPSVAPSVNPSAIPTVDPSASPTVAPSMVPSIRPTVIPSAGPTSAPSAVPTLSPSARPTESPSVSPSTNPTGTPSLVPTCGPTVAPTVSPTHDPTVAPSAVPTDSPTADPTASPSVDPTAVPSALPSAVPSVVPSIAPSVLPTLLPTADPSLSPSDVSTTAPTTAPSSAPTVEPSIVPTVSPSVRPSALPTLTPTEAAIPTALEIASLTAEMNPAAAKSSALVHVKLASGDGIIYCAAFGTSTQPSSVNAILSSGFSAVSSMSTATVSVNGLSAATSYDIYCATQSTAGVVLSLEKARQLKASMKTDCCKTVNAQLAVSNVAASSVTDGALVITLDSLPEKKVVVTLAVIAEVTGVTPSVFYPSTVEFSAISASRSATFTFAAGSSGKYLVDVSLSGENSDDYTTSIIGSSVITVLGAADTPAVPQLLSAKFANDGSYVKALFDSPTNKAGLAGTFQCSKLFTFVGDDAHTCQWSDASTVYMYARQDIATSKRLRIASKLSLRSDNMVKAACTQQRSAIACAAFLPSTPVEVAVQAPTTPTVPALSLGVASALTGCADLFVDLSASTGSGGRDWSKVTFSVTESSGDASAAVLQGLLNSNFTVSSPTVLKNEKFARSGKYLVSVELCNFLAACSSASRSVVVNKDAGNSPTVKIPGAAQRTVLSSAGLLLRGAASTVTCNGTVSYTNLQRSWSVFENGVLNVSVASQSLDTATFRLFAYRLTPLHYYEVVFTARNTLSGLSASSSVKLFVEQAPVVALVKGGPNQAVAIGSFITLDASTSTDGDVARLTGASAGLTFTWKCMQTVPTFSAVCPLDTASLLSQTLRLTADVRAINTTSLVTVLVADAAGARTSTATVTVRTQDSSAPLVAITSSAAKTTFVNTNNVLTLTGTVTVQSQCTARWSVDSAAVSLATSALSPASVPIPAGSTRVVNLVLSANALPMRESLVFTLTCAQSASTVTVSTNGPPLPGSFQVSPDSGQEMSQVFKFSAALWSDPNLPLSYQFAFISAGSGAIMVIQGRSESAYGSSTLPAGSAANDYKLSVVVQVYDPLSAFASTSSQVIVNPSTDPVELQSSMLAQITASAGSSSATQSAISLSSAVLNSVQCDPTLNCAALNRAACGTVQNTCGECLSGFVGQSGASNLLCVNATLAANAVSSVGKTCTLDAECGAWEVCDTTLTTPQCAVPLKQCLNACSGNGQCLRRDINSQAAAPGCLLSDPSCVAVCSCDVGYGGESCALTSEALRSKQVLREKLIESLSSIASTGDVSVDTLAAWGSSLNALSQDSYELSATAADTVNQLAKNILTSSASLIGTSYESAVTVLNAVDAATTATMQDSSSQSSPLTETLEAVALFNDLVSSQLVAGQDAVNYVYDTFRVSNARQVLTEALTLAVPLTPMEGSSGQRATSVEIQSEASTAEDELSVSLISTPAASYGSLGASFNTNPLQVKVARSSNKVTTVKFTLYNNAAVEFTADPTGEGMVFNTTCTATDSAAYTHTCSSGNVLTHNCSGITGRLMSYCPVLAPSCAILDTAAGTLNTNSSSCKVLSFDALSTSCECNITSSTSASRRLSDGLEQSGVLDVVSSSVYLANEFVNTFQSAEDFNSVEDLQRVLIVIIMFATLWSGGLLMICGCAYRRKVMEKSNAMDKVVLERKKQSAQVSRSPAAVRQYLADYVVETFPAVFSNKPFFSRLYGEITRHHRYLTLFTAPVGENGDKQRILTGVQLLTVQTMLMFLLSLLYDVQGPQDDGTCVQNTDESSCLSRKSPFDATQSYCQWQQQYDSCDYQQPVFTFQVVIFIAVMVSLLVAAIQYPIDRIFDLLTAPVADEIKISTQDTAIKRAGRRISNVARRASNMAMNAASAARNKITETHNAIVGTVTRKIPVSTEAAHALAAASMDVIAENSRVSLQDRQLARLRVCYELGQKYKAPSNHSSSSQSDIESGEDGSVSDSSSSSDESGAVEAYSKADRAAKMAVRKAEAVPASPYLKAQAQSAVVTVPESAVVGLPERTSTGSMADAEATLKVLQEEIALQRRLLKPSELDEFDAQWGVDPMGEFLQPTRSTLPCFKGKPGAKELILHELQFVQTETAKKTEKLNIATDSHSGLEILHLFIKDLLGRNTPAARIFETKSEEDFKHTKVVTRTAKRFAVAALIAINAFFIYYAMLTGFRRGLSWQRMYLFACIVQFVVEILLFETMECLWINCVIPMLVSDEVRTVGDSIIEVIQKLCSASNAADSQLFLNAPDYLFVSTNVAKKFPHLMESILVQAYSNHVPGELSKTWRVGAFARIQRHQQLRQSAALAGMLSTLQYWGTAPFIIHRMIVRFMQPFVFSALALLWQVILTDPVYISVTCVVLALAVAYGAYRSYTQQQEPHRQVESVNMEEVPKPPYVFHNSPGGPEMVRKRGGVNLRPSQQPKSQQMSSLKSSEGSAASTSDPNLAAQSKDKEVPITYMTASEAIVGNRNRFNSADYASFDSVDTIDEIVRSGAPMDVSPVMTGSPSPSTMLRFRKKFPPQKSVGQTWNKSMGHSDADFEDEGAGLSPQRGEQKEQSDLQEGIPLAPFTSPTTMHRFAQKYFNRSAIVNQLSAAPPPQRAHLPSIDTFSEISAETDIPPPPPSMARQRFDSDCMNSMERGSQYAAESSVGQDDSSSIYSISELHSDS